MAEFIIFVILTFGIGLLWGFAIHSQVIKFQLKRGKLPNFLKDRKSELITLLKEK